MALGTDYIIRYLSDIRGIAVGAKQIESINAATASKIQAQYGQVTKVIADLPSSIKNIPIKVNGQEAIKSLETVGQVVQTSNGSFLELSKTTTRISGNITGVAGGMKDVTNQFVKSTLETSKANKVFTNYADTIKQLGGRALLTIPIWLALRTVMTSFFSTISNGIKDLLAFDLSLQKIRNNLSGTTGEVESSFKRIRTVITQTSKDTGISTEEIAGAVKQFATLGFSAEESLQGAIGATKLSIALFGNASDTAEAFAKALNILIDRSAGAKTAADQMNEAFALTSQLEETNNFEIKGVTEALNKFAGTAAGVGLTMNETLKILAALGTAGRTGSEGATLLSTSFNTLLKNLPLLSKNLGITTQAGESTFSIFNRILAKITDLNNTPGGQSAAIQSISEIFGGARGIKIIQSLVGVKDILDKNIALTGDYNALNEKVTRTLASESKQAQILGNNVKEAGKEFIAAVFGVDGLGNAIKSLSKTIKDLGETIKGTGSIINAVFSNLGLIAGTAFLIRFKAVTTVSALFAGIAAQQGTLALLGGKLAIIFSKGFVTGLRVLGKLALGSLVSGFVGVGAAGILGAAVTAIFSPIVLTVGLLGKIAADAFTNEFIRKQRENYDKIENDALQFIDGLRGKLAIPELTQLITVKTSLLKPGDLAGAREIGLLRAQLQKQIDAGGTIPLDVKIQISFQEQQTLAKKILQNKLDELKTQGATNSEILKATGYYSQQLKIEESITDQVTRRLDLQKAINEEKRLEGKLSSDSIKLFDIAQTEGVDIARQIGDVLAGSTDFDNFIRAGGKAAEVFQKEFADLFKQKQAETFFKGNIVPGVSTLQGGSGVTIQEQNIQNPLSRFSTELSLVQKRAESLFEKLSNPQQEQNNNIQALQSNTASIQSLTETFKLGLPLFGQDAQRLVESKVQPKQVIDLNLNIDGRNLNFSGTPDAIRQLAGQLTPNIQQAVEKSLVDKLKNQPGSNISQAAGQNALDQ